MITKDNIFSSIPETLGAEITQQILTSQDIRIERILSHGHTTDWYDQVEDEWVIVIQGAAQLLFADGRRVMLVAGDYLNIPAHSKHQVSWTDPQQVTIWLAVFHPASVAVE